MRLFIRSRREALQPLPVGITQYIDFKSRPHLCSKKTGSHKFCFFIVNWRENKEVYQTTFRHLT